MTLIDRERRLATSAFGTGGLFSDEEARIAGFAPSTVQKRVERGLWVRVCPGFLSAAGVPKTAEMMERAAVGWLAPDVVLSHFSAARRLALPVPATVPAGWVTVPARRMIRPASGLFVMRSRHMPRPWRVEGMPVTSPARTVVDLAQYVDKDDLHRAMAVVIQRRREALDEVRSVVQILAGRPGVGLARAVVASLAPEFESYLEQVVGPELSAAGLDHLKPQFEVRDQAGFVVARVDLADEALRQAFEFDGWYYHGSPDQQRADKLRDRRMAAMGWATARFVSEDVLLNVFGTLREMRAILIARTHAVG